MQLIPDKFIYFQPKTRMHTMLYLVAAIVIVVAVCAAVLYAMWPAGTPTDEGNTTVGSSATKVQQKKIDAVSEQSSSTTSTSDTEKQKLINAASQTQSSPTTVPVSNVSAEERQKLIDAMLQKAQ